MQLDLFKDKSQTLEEEFTKLKSQQDNLRRGIFARFDTLRKDIDRLYEIYGEVAPKGVTPDDS